MSVLFAHGSGLATLDLYSGKPGGLSSEARNGELSGHFMETLKVFDDGAIVSEEQVVR